MNIPRSTITLTNFNEDGTIVNAVYMAPDDPETMAQLESCLGPLIMDGMVHQDELASAKGALNIGTAVHYDIEEG